MQEFETTTYDIASPGVARIMMNRPAIRNAQNVQMTYDLNECFNLAARDESVKVVMLGGADPHFSSGHDLSGFGGKVPGRDFELVGTWGLLSEWNIHNHYSFEKEVFVEMCRRWRDFPKPTIAMVQGKCIAGGLMLAWVCDIIIASDDASFVDPVVAMGVCGVEYFNHPYELGIRKAKELLFTADWWSADEAHRLGMVNHMVPRAELQDFALSMANRIAEKPAFALKLTKQAVNTAQDNMGQRKTMDTVFALHHLTHAHSNEMQRKTGERQNFRNEMKSKLT